MSTTAVPALPSAGVSDDDGLGSACRPVACELRRSADFHPRANAHMVEPGRLVRPQPVADALVVGKDQHPPLRESCCLARQRIAIVRRDAVEAEAVGPARIDAPLVSVWKISCSSSSSSSSSIYGIVLFINSGINEKMKIYNY